MAFAVEPLQKQEGGIVPAAQWVDVPRQKRESTAFWGKNGTLRFFLALGRGRAYNRGQKHQQTTEDDTMYENGRIYMGLAGDKRVEMALNMCNRHGLIAGASGTGKTVTMKVMAESFSDAGVPVFLCDV